MEKNKKTGIGRRQLLGTTVKSGALLAAGTAFGETALASESKTDNDYYGCLVDISRCIGCRLCERACNEAHHLPAPEEAFDDKNVFDAKRRPNAGAYTVVNRHYTGELAECLHPVPSFVKVQCMHCNDPACVSACIVGALTKKENGAVFYDASKCIGCRYCMTACPFQIPAYEYDNAFDPKVRKCDFCYDRISEPGGKTACASVCPTQALTFGKRSELLEIAENRIASEPRKYVDKIYGASEVGGTSWLYLSDKPFEKLGFLDLPEYAMPDLPEKIQHGLFKFMWAPATLFVALSGVSWISNRKTKIESVNEEKKDGGNS